MSDNAQWNSERCLLESKLNIKRLENYVGNKNRTAMFNLPLYIKVTAGHFPLFSMCNYPSGSE